MIMMQSNRFLSIIMAAFLIVAISIPVSAAEDTSEEFFISATEMENAQIRVVDKDLITITNTTIDDNNTVATHSTDSSDQIKSADITTIALMVTDSEDTEDLYNDLLRAANNNNSYKTKGACGLTIHTRVYYTTQTKDGSDWYKLIRVEGGNDKSNASNVIGSGFVIKKQSVAYGVWGRNLEGISPVTHTWSATKNLTNTATSFNINVTSLHSTWPTISEFQSVLGATYTVIIHSVRSGNDTTLELVNNPLCSVDFPAPFG